MIWPRGVNKHINIIYLMLFLAHCHTMTGMTEIFCCVSVRDKHYSFYHWNLTLIFQSTVFTVFLHNIYLIMIFIFRMKTDLTVPKSTRTSSISTDLDHCRVCIYFGIWVLAFDFWFIFNLVLVSFNL